MNYCPKLSTLCINANVNGSCKKTACSNDCKSGDTVSLLDLSLIYSKSVEEEFIEQQNVECG